MVFRVFQAVAIGLKYHLVIFLLRITPSHVNQLQFGDFTYFLYEFKEKSHNEVAFLVALKSIT